LEKKDRLQKMNVLNFSGRFFVVFVAFLLSQVADLLRVNKLGSAWIMLASGGQHEGTV
jgi:hypothetical protein